MPQGIVKICKWNAHKLPEMSFKIWVAQRGRDAAGSRQQFASWTRLTSDESEADKGAERTRVTENSFDTRRKWKQKPALHFLCYILLTSLDQITKNRLKRQPFSPFSHWMPSPPLAHFDVIHEACVCDEISGDIYTLYPDCISVSYPDLDNVHTRKQSRETFRQSFSCYQGSRAILRGPTSHAVNIIFTKI